MAVNVLKQESNQSLFVNKLAIRIWEYKMQVKKVRANIKIDPQRELDICRWGMLW